MPFCTAMECSNLPQRDPAYLAFVRTLPCACCAHPAPSDPHHAVRTWPPVSTGGTSTKGSDYAAVPLCRLCHEHITVRGTAWFEAQFGLEIKRVITATLIAYVQTLAAAPKAPARNVRPGSWQGSW